MALSFFLRLTLGHLIGDFVLQPYWLVVAKRNGWRGLLVHVGIVTFITAILVWAFIPHWWMWILTLYLGHLFIDQFRTFIFTDNSKGKGLLLLILDQVAHLMLIAILAWAATGWRVSDLEIILTGNAPVQHQIIVYLIGLAILIGVVPILEAEITTTVWAFQGDNESRTIAVNTYDRVVGGIERVVALTLILSGYGFVAPLIFLPRLGLMIYQGEAEANQSAVATKVVTSFVATLLVGYFLSYVPLPSIG